MPRITWTVEQARQAGLKSAARRAYLKANPIPQPPVQQPAQLIALPTVQPTDHFVARRLKRVRLQLELLDDRISEALAATPPDSRLVQALAMSSRSLEEQEARLSGRPGPGQRRPAAERTTRQFTPGPVEPPAPTPPPGV